MVRPEMVAENFGISVGEIGAVVGDMALASVLRRPMAERGREG
jgi:hypothetical protein